MAQNGYTPIQLYYTTTVSAVPTAGNLASGELAINITDGKLYYKDNGGVVQVIAGKGGAGVAAGSNTQVQFNSSGALGASSSLTWDGTSLSATKFAGALNGTVGATTPNTGAFTTVSASGVASFADGTVGTPGINFSSDTDTGVYRSGANSLSLVTGGTARVGVDVNGAGVTGQVTASYSVESTGAVQANSAAKATISYEGSEQGVFGAWGSNTSTYGIAYLKIHKSNGGGLTRIYCADSATVVNMENTNTQCLVAQTAYNGSTGVGHCLFLQSAEAVGTGSTVMSYYNTAGSAYKFFMYANGDIANATGVYGTISDARLKENIVDANPQLGKIMSLRVRNFNLIGDSLKQIGFVAQEVETVYPGLVSETEEYDGDKNSTGQTVKAVKTGVLTPILVKAIQELKAELDTLRAEFDAYKAAHP